MREMEKWMKVGGNEDENGNNKTEGSVRTKLYVVRLFALLIA